MPHLPFFNTINTLLTQLIFHKRNVSRGTVREDVIVKNN